MGKKTNRILCTTFSVLALAGVGATVVQANSTTCGNIAEWITNSGNNRSGFCNVNNNRGSARIEFSHQQFNLSTGASRIEGTAHIVVNNGVTGNNASTATTGNSTTVTRGRVALVRPRSAGAPI